MKELIDFAIQTQDFIEQNYPNYSSSDEILRNEILFKMMNDEELDDEDKDRIYIEFLRDTRPFCFEQFLINEFKKSQAEILSKAILNSK